MIKNLIDRILNPKPTRRSRRMPVDDAHDLLLFIQDAGYALIDVSNHGFAFKSDLLHVFTLGSVHQGTLEYYNQKPFPVEFKVARSTAGLIGCDVIQSNAYLEFLSAFRTRDMSKFRK
jgi:hypothetical protein